MHEYLTISYFSTEQFISCVVAVTRRFFLFIAFNESHYFYLVTENKHKKYCLLNKRMEQDIKYIQQCSEEDISITSDKACKVSTIW